MLPDVPTVQQAGVAGYNVVIHEFAHQLDMDGGFINGTPAGLDASLHGRWARVFSAEFDAIRRGEIVTVIGPNGAGKTTVLYSYRRLLHYRQYKHWEKFWCYYPLSHFLRDKQKHL